MISVEELTGTVPMSPKRNIRSIFLIIRVNLCNLWLISEAENKFGCKFTKFGRNLQVNGKLYVILQAINRKYLWSPLNVIITTVPVNR